MFFPTPLPSIRGRIRIRYRVYSRTWHRPFSLAQAIDRHAPACSASQVCEPHQALVLSACRGLRLIRLCHVRYSTLPLYPLPPTHRAVKSGPRTRGRLNTVRRRISAGGWRRKPLHIPLKSTRARRSVIIGQAGGHLTERWGKSPS